MAEHVKHIDVGNTPELLRIAEEVRRTNEPHVLSRDDEELAVLIPVKARPRRRRGTTEADLDAFRAAAGGWKDVDTDRLLADIYADRAISDRPPVEL